MGNRYSDYIVHWDQWEKSDTGLALRIPRSHAIRLLDHTWSTFRHAGNVPGLTERLEFLCSMGLSSMFPSYPVASCVKVGSKGGFPFGVSHTKKWLIDSGCGWDLVQESHVAHLEDLIRTPKFKPKMWTAYGVTRAEHEVPLYISELDEQCVPFILKNTPDVLTMGRRCMEDGYSFVWKGQVQSTIVS